MAVSMDQVDVADTATFVLETSGGATVVLAHRGTAVPIFIGHGAVAITDGFALEQNEVVTFQVPSGTTLSAIVATGTEELHYLLIQ